MECHARFAQSRAEFPLQNVIQSLRKACRHLPSALTAALVILSVSLFGLEGRAAESTPESCAIAHAPVQRVQLPASPFVAIPGADGCTVYVSLQMRRGDKVQGAVAAVKRVGGRVKGAGFVTLDRVALDMALTADGQLLAVADNDGVTFVDTARLAAGDKNAVVGHIDDGAQGAIYVALTPDDHFLFVSDEESGSISVIDLQKARASGFDRFAVVGRIAVGMEPVGLAMSPDGRVLYVTTQLVANRDWPGGCKSEHEKAPEHNQGAVVAIDVHRAETDPENAVVARAPALCNPVRVATSPSGDTLYVSARDSNALVVLDTARFLADQQDPELAAIQVGSSPIGLATFAGGKRIVIANSNRFSPIAAAFSQTLTVVDTDKIATSADPIVGTVEVGGFPRELRVTPDGRTLLVANFGSNSIYFVDIATMPVKRH